MTPGIPAASRTGRPAAGEREEPLVHRVTTRLGERMTATLAARARHDGVITGEVIRRALDAYLHGVPWPPAAPGIPSSEEGERRYLYEALFHARVYAAAQVSGLPTRTVVLILALDDAYRASVPPKP